MHCCEVRFHIHLFIRSSHRWFSHQRNFINYLHCTFRFPGDDVRLPTSLIITHLYCPESDRWTSVIVKLWLLLSDDAVSRGFVVMFSFSSFFVQVTLGEGFPSTTQLNTTYSPSTMVTSFGFSTISGATWNLKNTSVTLLNSNQWISKATELFLSISQSPRHFFVFVF